MSKLNLSKVKGGVSKPRNLGKGVKNKVHEIQVPSLHILNLHVKQGAGILFLVTFDEPKFRIVYSLLVDGGHGNNRNAIRDILEDHVTPGQRIDAACITHADADHANCAVKLKQYVKKYFVPYETVKTTLGSVTGTVPAMRGTETLWPNDAKFAGMPELVITWTHVWKQGQPTPDGENSMSLAAVVSWGKFKYYFDGDLHATKQLELARNDPVLRNVDCFYVTHHGSKNSSFPPFLLALNPTVAIISTGKNSFQHPHADTLWNLSDCAGMQKIVLTHCHYNRSLLNSEYWATEKKNFGRLYTNKISTTEADLRKLARDYLKSLETTVFEASNHGYIKPIDDMNEAISDARTALERLVCNKVNKKSRTIASMLELDMTEFNAMFDEMESSDTSSDVFDVAGDDERKSAIIISLEGLADHYDLAYRSDSQWWRRKFSVGKKDAALEYEQVMPTRQLYQRTERIYSDINFNNSNRYLRDLGAEVLYLCKQCADMIRPARAAVLFNCTEGACGGERAYHAQCLVKAWGTMDIPSSAKDEVEERIALLKEIAEEETNTELEATSDSDQDSSASEEEAEEEELGPLVLVEEMLCPKQHIVYSTRKRERDEKRDENKNNSNDDMVDLEVEDDEDTPQPVSKKSKRW